MSRRVSSFPRNVSRLYNLPRFGNAAGATTPPTLLPRAFGKLILPIFGSLSPREIPACAAHQKWSASAQQKGARGEAAFSAPRSQHVATRDGVQQPWRRAHLDCLFRSERD